MGQWSEGFEKAGEPLIAFGSWDELYAWDDEIGGMRGQCPFLEEQYVLNCYALYRKEELNRVVSGIYTDGYSGRDFTITGEVPIDDVGFDLCSLPLYWGVVDGFEVALYPEEIFANF